MKPKNKKVYDAIWDEMEGMSPLDAAEVLGRLLKDWEEVAFYCNDEEDFAAIFLDAQIPEHIAEPNKMN